MITIKCARLFTPISSQSSGAISYIISKYSQYPTFSHNKDEEIVDKDSFIYSPRSTYLNDSTIIFNTNKDVIPYHIIDVYPFKIIPFSYSITFPQGGSPAVKWEISGSNDKTNWVTLSSPPQNNSVCEENNPTKNQCLKDVSLLYQNSIPDSEEKQFRYLKYSVLRDRNIEYNPSQEVLLMRIKRLEFYGLLFGNLFCKNSKSIKLFNSLSYLFLINILL